MLKDTKIASFKARCDDFYLVDNITNRSFVIHETFFMQHYVCGFYFDHLLHQVALIWKNKPAWQKGKLNGIGGKIEENETPFSAMRREFKEETGVDHEDWNHLILLAGTDWKVYFFYAVAKAEEFEYVETQEEEEVAKIEIERLLAWDYQHIPNLDWLIPMALNKVQRPEEIMSFL